VQQMFNTVSGKKIAVFGFAFKKNTGDTRESPAITVVELLTNEGAYCRVFDPKVKDEDMWLELDRYVVFVLVCCCC
jgi:UDPglucose 6-dehydrogenase